MFNQKAVFFRIESEDDMKIKTEFIKLDQFLKFVNWVSSGGEAKLVISNEEVKVNGETETRRGRKLRPGDMVEMGKHKDVVESV